MSQAVADEGLRLTGTMNNITNGIIQPIIATIERSVPHVQFQIMQNPLLNDIESTIGLTPSGDNSPPTAAAGGEPGAQPQTPVKGQMPIGANVSNRLWEGPQERRSQEALLDPRQEPEPLVDSSTRAGTEKAPHTWQTQLHSCSPPLSQDQHTPAAQATGGHQPYAHWTPQFVFFLFSVLPHRLFRSVLCLPLLTPRHVCLHQALLPWFCRVQQRARDVLALPLLAVPRRLRPKVRSHPRFQDDDDAVARAVKTVSCV